VFALVKKAAGVVFPRADYQPLIGRPLQESRTAANPTGHEDVQEQVSVARPLRSVRDILRLAQAQVAIFEVLDRV